MCRSHLIDDPILWIEDKAKIDNVAGGLWRIHGKVYDFSTFAAKHPGAFLQPHFVSDRRFGSHVHQEASTG